MNTWIGIGNVGAKPAIKTSKDVTFATFSIAINGRRGGREYADWFKVVAFGTLAETLRDLDKGTEVAVQGSLHRVTYTDRNNVERHDVEVHAVAIKFLRRTKRDGVEAGAPVEPEDQAPDVPGTPEDDDIPF